MATPQESARKQQKDTGQGLHGLTKPIGPVCDLACEYCFYLEKHALFGKGENYPMSDDVLAAYIRQLDGPRDIHGVYRKYPRAMNTLLENGLPVSHVMEAVKGPLLIQRGVTSCWKRPIY
jgi:hypothetical protein